MQGVVRRKKDLLPRYGNKLHPRNNGSRNPFNYMTTPMKKILGYILLLLITFAFIKTVYSDLQHEPSFELDHESLASSMEKSGKLNIDPKELVGVNNEQRAKDKIQDTEKLMRDEKERVAVAGGGSGSGNAIGAGANNAAKKGTKKQQQQAAAAAAVGAAVPNGQEPDDLTKEQKEKQEEIKQQQQQQAPADKNNLKAKGGNNVADNSNKDKMKDIKNDMIKDSKKDVNDVKKNVKQDLKDSKKDLKNAQANV